MLAHNKEILITNTGILRFLSAEVIDLGSQTVIMYLAKVYSLLCSGFLVASISELEHRLNHGSTNQLESKEMDAIVNKLFPHRHTHQKWYKLGARSS